MALLTGLLLPFQMFNDVVLRVGRWIPKFDTSRWI